MNSTTQAAQKGTGNLAPLCVMYVCAFVAGFNENLVNMGLISIMDEFGVDSLTAQWLVTAYMIIASIGVVCMAFMFQRIKLRTLFFAGCAFALAGSVMGLLSTSFVMLLVARLVQAAGSSLFIPMMMNSILALAPRNKLGTFMSIGGCTITFGPAFAPIVCGAIVTAAGWRATFLVPLIAFALLAAVGIVFVKNLENRKVHLDVISVCLATLFLIGLSWGLAQITASVTMAAISLVAAAVMAIAFVLRQPRCANPLVDLTPMKSPLFWPASILTFISMMIMFSLSVLLPLYFQGALEMSAFVAGVVILIPVLVNAGCTLIAGRIIDKRGPWPLLPTGLLLAVLGIVGLAMTAATFNAPNAFACIFLVYAGIGFVFSPAQTAGLRTLPPQQNPFGVALMTTFVQIAACIGPALFTGAMSGSQGGATGPLASANGFAVAMWLAAGIAVLGFLIALAYTLSYRRAMAERRIGAAAPAHEPTQEENAGNTQRDHVSIFERATVRAVMEEGAYTVSADSTVRDAMQVLVSNHVGGATIVDRHDHPIGFVSDGDIMRYLSNEDPVFRSPYAFVVAAESLDEKFEKLVGLPVTEIASDKLISLDIDTEVGQACQMLAHHSFKRLPVMEDGRVVGVVSRSNVLRHAMNIYLSASEEAKSC